MKRGHLIGTSGQQSTSRYSASACQPTPALRLTFSVLPHSPALDAALAVEPAAENPEPPPNPPLVPALELEPASTRCSGGWGNPLAISVIF